MKLDDGGTISITWWWSKNSHDPFLLFFPGLNNSSHWPFVRQAVSLFQHRGFSVGVVDYRGVGSLAQTSQRCFGADSSYDFPAVVEAARTRMPSEALLFAVGHSMGGTCLAKYLTVAGANCPLAAAATISSPYNLSGHVARLESSLTWRAANLGTVTLAKLQFVAKYLMDPKSRAHLGRIKWSQLLCAMTLRGLERATVCPLNGYRDPEDYYAYAQPDVSRLADCGVPLLLLHAMDDPIIGVAELPLPQLRALPNVRVVLTETGGHLGYCGSEMGAKYVDELLGGFFERVAQERRVAGGVQTRETLALRARL